MALPQFLEQAIKNEWERCPQSEIARASEELSRLYHDPSPSIRLTGDAIHTAYLAVRMPATFAVVSRVLQELNRWHHTQIKSLLDIGSGPGTVLWAAEEQLPSLESALLLEQNPTFVAIAKRIAEALPRSIRCRWEQANISDRFPDEKFDLITASYVIGELAESALVPMLEKSWAAAGQALIIIEPGTPRGFARILMAREWLIGAGAHIAAPCPHQGKCPMVGTDRWCHFSQRLQRSSLHRTAKGASLGYEDEKYSYLIALKGAVENPQARAVGHPRKHSGHLNVDLCTGGNIVQRTYSRRDGPLYKIAQKLSWGDSFTI